jgi:hypothetical protein
VQLELTISCKEILVKEILVKEILVKETKSFVICLKNELFMVPDLASICYFATK